MTENATAFHFAAVQVGKQGGKGPAHAVAGREQRVPAAVNMLGFETVVRGQMVLFHSHPIFGTYR